MSFKSHKHGGLLFFDGIRPRTDDMYGFMLTMLREAGRNLALSGSRRGCVARGLDWSNSSINPGTKFNLSHGMVFMGDTSAYNKETPTAGKAPGEEYETRTTKLWDTPRDPGVYEPKYEDHLESLAGSCVLVIDTGQAYDSTKVPSGVLEIPWASTVKDVWNVVALEVHPGVTKLVEHPLQQGTDVYWGVQTSYKIRVYTQAEWGALTEDNRRAHIPLWFGKGNGATVDPPVVEVDWFAAPDTFADQPTRAQIYGGSPYAKRGLQLMWTRTKLVLSPGECWSLGGHCYTRRERELLHADIIGNPNTWYYCYAVAENGEITALAADTKVPTKEGLHPEKRDRFFVGSVRTGVKGVLPFKRYGDEVHWLEQIRNPMRNPTILKPGHDEDGNPMANVMLTSKHVQGALRNAGTGADKVHLDEVPVSFQAALPATTRTPLIKATYHDEWIRQTSLGPDCIEYGSPPKALNPVADAGGGDLVRAPQRPNSINRYPEVKEEQQRIRIDDLMENRSQYMWVDLSRILPNDSVLYVAEVFCSVVDAQPPVDPGVGLVIEVIGGHIDSDQRIVEASNEYAMISGSDHVGYPIYKGAFAPGIGAQPVFPLEGIPVRTTRPTYLQWRFRPQPDWALQEHTSVWGVRLYWAPRASVNNPGFQIHPSSGNPEAGELGYSDAKQQDDRMMRVEMAGGDFFMQSEKGIPLRTSRGANYGLVKGVEPPVPHLLTDAKHPIWSADKNGWKTTIQVVGYVEDVERPYEDT